MTTVTVLGMSELFVLCHTQDVVDPLLFTTSGEEHVIPKEATKGVVSKITVVDNKTAIEIDEGGVLSAFGLVERVY